MMLEGQIALVTGASRGIGHAIALELGKAGASVIGTATSPEGAARISSDFASASVKGASHVLDVNNRDQIEQVIREIENRHGAVSVLVNNAGVTRDNLLLRMKDDEWDQVIDTDLRSIYRLSKAVLRPMMKARFGRIISITSVIGAMGNAGQANYAAAKAGIVGFTKALAQEVGSRNITVNCIAPGFIETDMTRAVTEEQKSALLSRVPLGRLGTPGDVAGAVVFLASPGAAYITGCTLHVNGGMYMV
ncbi:MAG TPA: 3-oxoacyl-ACP reductase FabG [Burkholderiales bacterium]|nr:3-oxoacyl-ACP reductase FabG [Burkholderiales bacterium]